MDVGDDFNAASFMLAVFAVSGSSSSHLHSSGSARPKLVKLLFFFFSTEVRAYPSAMHNLA